MKQKTVEIGSRFGKLTVIKEVEPILTKHNFTNRKGIRVHHKHKIRAYLCKCDCGNEVVVRVYNLTGNITHSCGCLRRKTNEYEILGDVAKVFAYNGKFALVDTEDLPKLKGYRFYCDKNGYFICRREGKAIRMQRVIMDCPNNMVVDHINHNPSDNRKSNLRICTIADNNRNRNFKGVSFSAGKWQAYICVNYKTIYLGRYTEKTDAIKARKEAEEKYFGDFRYKENDNVLVSAQS